MNAHPRSPLRWRSLAAGASFALVAGMLATGPAYADDGSNGTAGKPILKSMSQSGQETTVVEGHINENEHAFIQMMKFYVPIQAANGSTDDALADDDKLDPREYYDIEGTAQSTRDVAKPLISVYLNGPVEGVDGVGFTGHGLRDAYGAVSLDDGVTWKNTNLSQSAEESSSDLVRDDISLFTDAGVETYPGDVSNIFHAVAGNRVLVAWQSRFCSSGQPNYSLDTDEPSEQQAARRDAIAYYLTEEEDSLADASPDDLYLIDMYKVGGKQGSVDYADDKWEQNWPVGEVPFNCLWTARGELVQGDDPRTEEVVEETYMRWFNAERLTSGRRDVNRIETQCVEGAGCAITWQEDPEGLRPGQGEGPGEGWSGAIANSQTDVWYSYIDWENFDVVQDPNSTYGEVPMAFLDYEALAAGEGDVTQKPKPFIPFAMPMRLTDNAKCNPENPAPYCYGSALVGNEIVETVPVFPDADATLEEYGLRDMCSAIVEIPAGKDHDGDGVVELKPVCIPSDSDGNPQVPLIGNTASTRPRLGLYGYDSDGDVPGDAGYVVDSAFVVVVAEEDKGLGAFGFYDPMAEEANACTPTDNHDEVQDPDCVAFDEGKNIWYHTFSMALGDTMGKAKLDATDSLLANLTFHGNMLNQPEVSWEFGDFYAPRSTADMWGFGEDYDYEIVNTEIARRGSLLAQDFAKVLEPKSKTGLAALPTWKQGTMNQGGPADVMSRRILVPKKWKLRDDGNPYAFRNMACEDWVYAAGENPMYPGGLCADSAINLSATIPDSCVDTDTDGETDCPTLTEGTGDFLISDTNPILQGKELDDGDDATKDSNTDKVLTWHQCPASFTNVSGTDGTETVACEDTETRPQGDSTLADQSWYNPLEVAKGHRGFLDGDFVMMLYAWSPNWRLNAKGSDRYELYIRRSFDGAQSWGTLPSSFTASDGDTYSGDGTVTCETYRSADTGSDKVEPRVCNSYGAGAAEQARNVTQLQSMRTTTLDPRYAATSGSITADPFGFGIPEYTSGTGGSEDERDPSRYFIAYETGDNTTTELGEPEPEDLFYSRAINFGDDYVVWSDELTLDTCYPSDPHDDIDEQTGVPVEIQDSGFCNEFDQLDRGTPGVQASEASLTANPGGEFLYGAWAQLEHEDDELVASDAMSRRVWWIDGFTSDTYDWVFGQGPNN